METHSKSLYGYALASLILGFASVLAWASPVPYGAHVLSSALGLWLGLQALRSPHRGMAVTGASMCGMVFAIDVIGYVVFILFP